MTSSLRVAAAVLLCALAGVASAQRLGVKPGLWEKTITITTEGGKIPEVVTMKACLRPEDLDLARTVERLARGGNCSAKALEATPRRISVEFRCGATSGRSTTEVVSDERVVVDSSTAAEAGGAVVKTRATEEWRFLRDACAG